MYWAHELANKALATVQPDEVNIVTNTWRPSVTR